ncbi:MAG: polyprenyl synthetase family protein, partial [Clostridiales bacterium]|nr:polyprenyl synthetase family protein [Clostridiales bacterium]
DILDDADVRRSLPTVYKKRGRRAAVHSGDYFLTLYASRMPYFFGTDINQALTETSRQMCLGELVQSGLLFDMRKQTEDAYFLQIRRKTALLMSDCCYCGAVISGLPRIWQEALKQFGLYLGMAFQVRDDILDFSDNPSFGKAFGQDLMQGIFTLPLLRAAALTLDRDMIALAEKRDKTPEDLIRLRDWVIQSGGLASAKEVADDLNDRALASLEPLPAGPVKGTLMGLASALAGREK